MTDYEFTMEGFFPIDESTGGMLVFFTVQGIPRQIQTISVTLNGLTHENLGDLDVFVGNLAGDAMMFFSDVGEGFSITDADITIADDATSLLPHQGEVGSGSYLPTTYDEDPAEGIMDQAGEGDMNFANVFGGGVADGIWLVALTDDTPENNGFLEGITLTFTTGAPTVDLNGYAAGVDAAGMFTKQTPLHIAPDPALVSDPDSQIESMTITLTNRPDNVSESLSVDVGIPGLAASYDSASGTLLITGTASAETYQDLLRNVVYSNSSADPSQEDRIITVTAEDAEGAGNTATLILSYNGQPTDIALSSSSVAETSAGGAVVGRLSADDPDGDQLTFELVDDAGGRFEIVGNEIVVAAGAAFDFETAQSHAVTVRASDPDGLAVERTITIAVSDIDEAPGAIAGLSAEPVAEGSAAGTLVSELPQTDSGDEPIAWELVDGAGGRFMLDGSRVEVADGLLLDFEQAAAHQVVLRAIREDGTISLHTLSVGVADVDPESVRGGPGDDVLIGGAGADRLYGDAGDDTLTGGAGPDMLKGHADADTLSGGSGDDDFHGGAGRDDLFGGQGADMMRGMAGWDEIRGGADGDTLHGNAGRDELHGGAGDDVLRGHAGRDELFGNGGSDELHGGFGADLLDGGRASDTLKGGEGKDVLIGGRGRDALKGGAGADTFTFREVAESSSERSDTITDFGRGNDVIDLSAIDAGFDFIGDAAFSDTAGELRVAKRGGDTFVYGDADGDGSADLAIRIEGRVDLTQDDFVL